MTRDKVLRLLVCWMVTLAVNRLRFSALAAIRSDGAVQSPRAPRVVDGSTAPTSIVIQDHIDMIVNFTLKVTGKPECNGWFLQIDPMRKAVPRNKSKFVCKALNLSGDSDGRSKEYHLVISYPTKQDIGQYTVRFSNNEGSTEYKFEIKGKEENETWPVVYIVIATAIGGVVVLVTVVVAIAVVFRGRCCRSRQSRRSVKRARDNVYDDSEALRESARKPHSRSKPAKPQRTSRQGYSSTTTTINNNNTTVAATPKAESSPAAARPSACAKFPPLSPPPVDSHSSPAGGREFLCVEPEELAKAISSTLKRYQSMRSNNALLKSRRMSRSVPGLCETAVSSNNNYNNKMTPRRERLPFQSLMPPLTIAAAAAATPREMGHRHGTMQAKKHQHQQQQQQQHQQQQQQKKCRAKYGSAEDSGFAAEWEEDDNFSVFDSVSTVAAVETRRRKYSLDDRRCSFWRRSLQFVDGEVTSDCDSDSEGNYSKVVEETGRNANSLNESKYMSMTRFYRGSRFPSQHKEAGDVPELLAPCPDSPPLPLPPPPPPLPCVMQRVYENVC